MGKFYDDLKKSFEDILDYHKRRIKLRSKIINKGNHPPVLKIKDHKEITPSEKQKLL